MAEVATNGPAETTVTEKEAPPLAPAHDWRPLEGIQREFNRMFGDFPWGQWRIPFTRTMVDFEPFWRTEGRLGPIPAVDVIEKDDAYEVTAELPGMTASEVEVKFANGALTIKGEKREEKEEKKKGSYVSERRYGMFQRTLRVPDGIDEDKIEARFDGGVLRVILPKTPEAQKAEKTIPVQQG
jgi:HSP20 family protein